MHDDTTPLTAEIRALLERRRGQEKIREYLVDYHTHKTQRRVNAFRACVVWATVGVVGGTAAYLATHSAVVTPPPEAGMEVTRPWNL